MNVIWNFLCSLAAVLVLFTTVGHSIYCFQCSSVTDLRCENLESSNTSIDLYKECTGNYHGKQPFCRKTIQTIIDRKKIVRVHRSCGWLRDQHNHRPCYKYENDFHYEIVCVCDTDGCNSAPRAQGGPWALVLTLVGALVLTLVGALNVLVG